LPPLQIHVSNRPDRPLFAGEQGRQRTEINYDHKTQIVTLRLVVQDSNGYFIPDIHRESFAVYENGIRQQNATVEIEHAAVTAGVLVEYGGHYHALNEALADAVSMAVGQFADEIGPEDNVAVWKYGDRVEEISGFTQGNEPLHQAAASLRSPPPFSELNLYDALIATLPRLHEQSGRRALLLISSGIDTFSKAGYADTLRASDGSDVAIYALNIGPFVRNAPSLYGLNGPYTRLDWQGAEQKLSRIAQASGVRMYSPDSSLDLAAVYDDLMENLRVRYVIRYKSTSLPCTWKRHRADLDLIRLHLLISMRNTILNHMVHYKNNQLDDSFAALSDVTRRGVLEQLARSDASITDLAGRFQMTLTGMKKHVSVLEQAGLVTTEKIGRVRTCRLGRLQLQEEMAWMERYRQLWAARFDGLDAIVEELKQKEKRGSHR